MEPVRRLLALIAFTATMLASAAATGAPQVSGRAGTIIDETIESLGTFWGSVLVARDEKTILLKGYGSTATPAAPLTADHHFDLGEVSAHFTAAAILVLRQEGRLKLDDTIGAHLDTVPDDKSSITLAHLLGNASGLDSETDLSAANPFEREASVAAMLSAPLRHEPGAAYTESDVAFTLLAAIVERVSGEPFETFLRKRVFEPAGMTATGFVDGEHLDPAMDTERVYSLYGHSVRASTREEIWDWTRRGATGVVSTARDLQRWDRALRGPAILDAESIELMFTPGRNGFAMGWYVETLLDGTRQASRAGRANGYVTKFVRSLDRDAVVAVLGRPSTPIDAAERAVIACLFVDEPETVVAHIATRGQPRNDQGVILFEEGRWSVGPVPEGVLVRLGAEGKPPALEVRMSRDIATRLLVDLENALVTVGVDALGRVGVEAAIYGSGYPLDEERRLVLPPLAIWMVVGAYRGVEGGVEVVDERVTVILADEIRQFWPVVAKTSKDEATRLAAGLRDAIRGD